MDLDGISIGSGSHAFCCFLCEFFWRRARIAEDTRPRESISGFSIPALAAAQLF